MIEYAFDIPTAPDQVGKVSVVEEEGIMPILLSIKQDTESDYGLQYSASGRVWFASSDSYKDFI